ncbi:MAG: PotD/PotF family extracellular solute-binding protein [Acidimicrobiia bacterium]
MAHDDSTRILISRATAQRLAADMNRRRFLGVAGAGALATMFLAACGGDDGGSSAATGGSTAGSTSSGGTSFNLYTWAEYDDPEVLEAFGNITVDVYDSNEIAISKLSTAKGTSGYDMVCPTGAYIPQMVGLGLLQELDLGKIPNFANLETAYTNQVWDPGNKHSVCKDWGSTGWIYDNTVVKTPINSWSDFIKAAQTEASGATSVLDTAPDLCGIYFWANGIDWNTEKAADLDACEKFIVDELASHLKAFDSFPGISLTSGNYALSQAFNGDARQGLLKVEEAGGDPTQYTWGLGAPASELWMDNWCILQDAKNTDACYKFINYILQPAESAKEVAFHGYHTGVKGVAEASADLQYADMIFFTDAQVKTLQGGVVNTAQSRQVDILAKAKAKAGA